MNKRLILFCVLLASCLQQPRIRGQKGGEFPSVDYSFRQFDSISNSNVDGYSEIPMDIVKKYVIVDPYFFSPEAKFWADYLVNAGQMEEYKIAKLRCDIRNFWYDIYVIYDSLNNQLDAKIILNLCSGCGSWKFFSRSGAISNAEQTAKLGLEIYFYDTINQERVLHPDILNPIEKEVWRINTLGTFVKIE